MSKVIQAGIVTAYGAAVRGGYTGTYDKFCSDLAELADVLSEFLGFRVTIETLDEGTQATASYNDGVLALGIPRGNTGNGIQRIERISTQGLVKTYRITYTSGTYFDFQVSDGNGIDHTTLNADYTLTITYTDGTTWTSGSIRGATGATPALTIGTVETLLPTQSATATITGTPEDPVLNLGIPKGDTGEVSQAEFDDLSGTVSELNRQISESITPAIEEIETALDGKAPAIYETVSGEIASFSDGADGMPVKSLIANIEPVQDLHGYANPWPAGGGKNKLPYPYFETSRTASGITFTVGSDGSVKVSGTSTAVVSLELMHLATNNYSGMIISGSPSGSTINDAAIAIQYWNGGAFSSSAFETGNGLTLTESDQIIVLIRVASGATINKTFYPMIRASGTDATFAPYSNICPISGWTGCEGKRTGVNVWDEEWINGEVDTRTGAIVSAQNRCVSKNYININSSASYYFYSSLVTSAYLFFYDKDKNYIGFHGSSLQNRTFIPKNLSNALSGATFENAKYMLFRYDSASIAEGGVSINYPSTDTEYHEGHVQSLSITFPTEAGTVYGGTLDVTNGVLTVDRAMMDMGAVTWNSNGQQGGIQRWSFHPVGMASGFKADVISTIYKSDISPVATSGVDFTICRYGGDVYAYDSRTTSPSTLKQLLQDQVLIYPLANSVTYQLTPQELDTLLGTNNIWADVGTVDVEYPADTKLYIEQLTKPTEDDMTANANIAANKFFMIGNTLYFSTAAIAQGATIIPGTNCNVVSLADALNNLNS